MPFPLAHPAAVLPLRRVRALCFPALLIGTVTPDVAYMFPGAQISAFAHQFAGSFLFCLPVGLLAFVIFEGIRRPLVAALPSPHRQAFAPWTAERRHGWGAVALSILIGAWTHILLDAVTRESEILVLYLGPLREEIALLQRSGLRFSRLLWVAFSLAGMGWLGVTYLQQVHRQTGSWRIFDPREKGRYVLWLGVALVPLILVASASLGHLETLSWRRVLSHFVYHSLATYLVTVSCLVVLIGFGLQARQFWRRPSAVSND
jgi:hypothetical protein